MSTNDQVLTGASPGRPSLGTTTEEAAGVDVQALGLAALTWRRFRKHKLALIGGVVIVVLTLAAILAPLIAPYDPNYGDFAAFNAAPSAAHWLGTDFGGRDMLSRILYGGRISLLIGFTSMITAILFGTLLGAIAGYCGGWIDNVLMRLTDVVLSFPLYLLLFGLSAFIAVS